MISSRTRLLLSILVFTGLALFSICVSVAGTPQESEPPLKTEQAPLKVCLSPGHPSDRWDKLLEAVLNRKVAFLLEDRLLAAGFETKVVTNDLSREDLFSVRYSEKLAMGLLEVMLPDEKAWACNDWDADYMISIHHNHSPDRKRNHTLVLYSAERNREPRYPGVDLWAEFTAEALGKTMATTRHIARGDMKALGLQLTVLLEADMPSILTEASFFSCTKEAMRLRDDDYLEGEAHAIFDAFTEFLYKTEGIELNMGQ